MFDRITKRIADSGIDDAVGILLHGKRTVLHVGLGTVVPGDPRLGAVQPDDEAPSGQLHEYHVGAHVALELPNTSLASPERLTRLMQSNNLTVADVLRHGRYADQHDLIDDVELVEMAGGESGWNQISVTVSGRPSRVVNWTRMRERLRYTLFGNPQWQAVLDLWLDEVEKKHSSVDVVIKAYNPCDLMAALVHGYDEGLVRLLPEVQGALDLPGVESRMLSGQLVWDGGAIPDFETTVRSVYPTVGDWGIARATGTVWQEDLALLELLGLRYALFEFAPDNGEGPWELSSSEGKLVRNEAEKRNPPDQWWASVRSLSAFLETIEAVPLIAAYRKAMVPVSGGDQWLVIDGPLPEHH